MSISPATLDAWLARPMPADHEPCASCDGAGTLLVATRGEEGERVECWRCGGAGHRPIVWLVRVACACGGHVSDCPDCDGHGSREEERQPDEVRDQHLGTAAQQAEAALVCAALDWIEERARGREMAPAAE